jgi:hypothetical protein
MDEDLAGMSRDQLIGEIRKLRQGIRTHWDSTGHDLCWHHPALWGLLPDKQEPVPEVPPWPEFLHCSSSTTVPRSHGISADELQLPGGFALTSTQSSLIWSR